MADTPTLAHAAPTVGGNIDYTRFLDCVHCGLCTSSCPTYLETGDENNSPRGRIYLMRAVVDGRLPLSATVLEHLDLCLDCRNCETACPSGVQYGRLIEPFRVDTLEQPQADGAAPRRDWFQRFIMFGLFPYARRLKWAVLPARLLQLLHLDAILEKLGVIRLLPQRLQRMQRLLPRLRGASATLPKTLPARDPQRARVALFTGCVSEAMFSETNRATARVLQENGCEVVIPRNQVCCGAIHYHNGASAPALEFAARNAAAFDALSVDAVIVNVAGCGAMMKDYTHIAEECELADAAQRDALKHFTAKVKDVSEFLIELGPVPPTGPLPVRATYHDACHLAHAQQIQSAPRELLNLIPELELIPLPESDLCCGAAGSYNLTQPKMADSLGQRKIDNIARTSAQYVVAANAGCSLQIQAALRQNNQTAQVVHPIDLLDLSYRNAQPPT